MEEEEEMAGAVGKEEMAGATGKEEMAEVTGKEEIAEAVGKEEIAWATVKEEKENQDEEKDKKLAGAQCCDSRWRVSYISNLVSRKKRAHKGSMLLRAVANRIVLYDNTERQIDIRNLHVGELIYHGSVLHFPCHKVDVGECIFHFPQQLSGAVEHQLPSNEDEALFTEDGEGHLLDNADELGVDKENGKKRRNKKDGKKAKRRKLQEEQEMRDEKKTKLDEEQEMRDAKKRKRLKAAAGMRLVRSPAAMIAKVVKQMSPQANLSGSGRAG